MSASLPGLDLTATDEPLLVESLKVWRILKLEQVLFSVC